MKAIRSQFKTRKSYASGRGAVLLWIIISLIAPVSAQQKPASERPPQEPAPSTSKDEVVRITTNLVQIDAAVTDKKGKPVTDLSVEDFEIYEDGRPQKITNFSFVTGESIPTPSPVTASQSPNVRPRSGSDVATPPPTISLRREQVQRTIALVVDDLGLSFESTAYVRNALRKFVDQQMQPGDLVAIIRTGAGVGALQQFTADKRMLQAAIDRVKWNSQGRTGVAAFASIEDSPLLNASIKPSADGPVAPSNSDQRADMEKDVRERVSDFKDEIFSVGTLGALNYIIRGLRTLPGRKSVVLLSDTMTLFDSTGEENYRTIQALRRLTDLANRASVVIYTIDPRGLPALNLTASDNVSGVTTLDDGSMVRANGGPGLLQSQNQRTTDLWASQEGLRYLALETGGFFVTNNNDINAGIKKALDAAKNYYLIGYRPDESTFDPQTGQRHYHNISVQVKRPGLVVRTRTGFFGVSNEEARPIPRTTAEALTAAIMTPFASNDIDLRLTSVFLNSAESGPLVRSLIYVDGKSLTFKKQPDNSYLAAVDVLAMTFDDSGVAIDRRSRTQPLSVSQKDYQAALEQGLIFGINLPIKTPGAFQLRIAVRDAGSGLVGSANQYIEVPNLKKGRVTISGIYLARHQEAPATTSTKAAANNGEGASSADQNSDARVAERDPQGGPAIRRFPQGALLDYGFEIYNAHLDKSAHQPHLQTQVRLFRDNQLVFSGKVLELNGLPDSRRLVAFGRLPLPPNLSAGNYVLQMIAADTLANDKNRLATQWIDFEIK